MSGKEYQLDGLPYLPWHVEVTTVSGRRLLSLNVSAGDFSRTVLSDGSSHLRGAAARVDLSCGRIDVWWGPPLLGGVVGPGQPGDCDP
jgi:hypothetical protein